VLLMDSCVIFVPELDEATESEEADGPATLPAHLNDLLGRVLPLFGEVLLATAAGSHVERCPVPVIMSPPGAVGRLAALYGAIGACEGNPIFIVAADRPLLSADLVRYMRRLAGEFDVVIPRCGGSYDPLFAFYTRRCLRPMEKALEMENRRVASFFDQIRLRGVEAGEVRQYDPHMLSLKPIHCEAEYARAARLARTKSRAAAGKPRKRRRAGGKNA
jgi:molybdopterin-guanine dinucleotide biosynthesis protein A